MTQRSFWNGETAAIVKAMKATGNQSGVVARWKDAVADWAHQNRTDPDAASVNAWLPFWVVRPFYTVEELAPIWPALAIAVGHTDKWRQVVKSPKRLQFELDFAGLPHIWTHGRRYYLVERIHMWQKATQEEIDNVFNQ